MVRVENISKTYGTHLAADKLNFELSKGDIVGFIGANGAGKSTTMRMLAGASKPDEGRITIFGHDVIRSPLAAKKHIGYLPEDNPLYEHMYVREYLEYVAKLYHPNKDAIEQTIQQTGLEQVYKRKIQSLSKGNRQRVGLAQALIHNPDFLILDEPTSGLDPHQQHEIRELIVTISAQKIIFFSTHILQEVSNICSRTIIIDKARIIHDGVVQKGDDIESLFFGLTT